MGLNALLPGAVVGGDVYRAVVLRRAGQAAPPPAGRWCWTAPAACGCCAPSAAWGRRLQVLAPWLRLPAGAFAALLLAGTALWLALPWGLLGCRAAARRRAALALPRVGAAAFRASGLAGVASAAVGLSAAALAGGGWRWAQGSPAWAFAIGRCSCWRRCP
jgi:hypothetical protein